MQVSKLEDSEAILLIMPIKYNDCMHTIDSATRIIWDYMKLNQTIHKADALFVLCSHDTRVAEYAAQLFIDGYAPWLIISGGSGKLTEDLFNKPEAEVFADIAIQAGVPKDKIIIESKSTNTGENIRFTYELLVKENRDFNSFILVQKPYMERRTYATFLKQWPGEQVDIHITLPRMSYDKYFSGGIDKELAINVMVGDLQRIREYPELGHQIAQDIPDDVWNAYEELIRQGYTKHLIGS